MITTLRVLGVLCLIGAAGCVVDLLPAGLLPSLAFSGILFLALATILDRLVGIESFLELMSAAGPDRVRTALGEFRQLGKVEGQAMCVGCRRTVPKAGLYYNESLDAHYHPECLSRDCKSR